MTVGGVTNRAHVSMDPADLITTSGGALAEILLDTQAAQREADHEQLALARRDYEQALAEEVTKMHEAADKLLLGAVVQGSIGVVAGAAGVYGSMSSQSMIGQALDTKNDDLLRVALKDNTTQVFGSSLSQLGAPIGRYVSGADGQHALADAKAAAGEAEQAKWQMDDSQRNINDSNEASKNATRWAESLVSKNDQAVSSLIGNIA